MCPVGSEVSAIGFEIKREGGEEMKFYIEFDSKKIRVSFWKWVVYDILSKKLSRIDKKLDLLLEQHGNQSTNKTTDNRNFSPEILLEALNNDRAVKVLEAKDLSSIKKY